MDELRRLLNEWDPIGVFDSDIPGGWTADEYDCLQTLALGSLRRGDTVEESARLLDRQLREHFGLDRPTDACRGIAEDSTAGTAHHRKIPTYPLLRRRDQAARAPRQDSRPEGLVFVFDGGLLDETDVEQGCRIS